MSTVVRKALDVLRRTVVSKVELRGIKLLETHEALYELRSLSFMRQSVVPGTVAFMGSSSIRLWRSLASDFAPLPVLNRGLGGSQVEHLLRYQARLLTPGLAGVVIYAGENDLAADKSPEHIMEGLTTFLGHVEAVVPGAPVLLLSVKVSPSREFMTGKIATLNRALMDLCGQRRHLRFVDVSSAMTGPDGRPRNSLYQLDGLHMSGKGYALWSSLVWPVLEDALATRKA